MQKKYSKKVLKGFQQSKKDYIPIGLKIAQLTFFLPNTLEDWI